MRAGVLGDFCQNQDLQDYQEKQNGRSEPSFARCVAYRFALSLAEPVAKNLSPLPRFGQKLAKTADNYFKHSAWIFLQAFSLRTG